MIHFLPPFACLASGSLCVTNVPCLFRLEIQKRTGCCSTHFSVLMYCQNIFSFSSQGHQVWILATIKPFGQQKKAALHRQLDHYQRASFRLLTATLRDDSNIVLTYICHNYGGPIDALFSSFLYVLLHTGYLR